ncbi:hypothetical protein EOA50_28440 [Mesorhizobium sp. M1A.F.Ca.IN.020.30.1.1]|uniref:hypothetical protein n=1 Tax=unclassified Mesorhizobium TaxID=325217 RepID=UPI000FD483AF|nr:MULTISPECIES: hypothetical protein [unclassified Mesorhizobium]RUV68243.1 hypothetical protein EOA50_28440 [Mesorhizobium sp. M1A.F.Ca.IN.020.30.1.1]RWG31471.1 MAG: hypothetical protein EOQ59_23995 [Mesorhizobium sp.]RWG74773.1 MAG: hypothetical protein EOQ66_03395 [Mesorhizobium sp.]TIM78440.1 MAG: hypothetical protein E5Y44_03060 [Mesorhizobium sp.]TIM83672.1 MAG: hypothetical protein E5Y43_27330 [Mesorhizobium sp.]
MPKPKLSPDDIDRIVNLLTSWNGKLTWDLLVDKVTAVLGRPYSRQALDAHDSIKIAFDLAKERVRKGKRASPVSPDISPELATALERVETLRAEVAVLKQQRDGFLETFAVWLYNARNRGLTERDLNQPLPPVERHRSAKK